MSYGELEDRAAGLQQHLQSQPGVCAADAEPILVLFFERTDVELYVSWLAAQRAGVAVACVDPSFPDGFLLEVIADAQAPLILTSSSGAERLRSVDCGSSRVIDVSALDLDGTSLPEPASLAPDALAYVIYTSGTTGKPKGVMIEHGSLDNLIAADLEEFDLGPEDRVAQVSSPAYDSWVEETWLAFSSGATLVVVDKETQRLGPDLVPWLREERITALCPPPTLLRMAASGKQAIDLPDLRLLYVGGEALTEDVVQSWAPGRRLVNGYGPTECTVTVIRGDVRSGDAISLGQPVKGNEAHLEADSGGWLTGPGTGEL